VTLAAIAGLVFVFGVVVLDELSKDETEKLDLGIVTADILRVDVCVYAVVSRFFVLCYHPIITRAASASC
jgi:hypothetical protein